MAKFVKQRARVVERQQRRLAGARLGEIADIVDDRQLPAIELVLAAQRAHPGAGPLRLAGEIITEEEPARPAVAVGDRPDPHIRVPGLRLGQGREGEAEQPAGHVEGGRDHPVELEIRLQLALVDGELPLPPLLGVIAPVPGLQRMIVAALAGQQAERRRIVGRPRLGMLPDLFEQRAHGDRRLGHRVVQLVGRKAVEAEQPRLLGPQPENVGHDLPVVGRALVLAAARPGAEGFFAQVAPRRVGQERHDHRARQGDGVVIEPAIGGNPGHGRDQIVRKTRQIVLFEAHHPIVFVGQNVLGEASAERGQFGVDLGQPLAIGPFEPRAAAHEARMDPLEKPPVFRRQSRRCIAIGMDRIDTGEKRSIESDLRRMA